MIERSIARARIREFIARFLRASTYLLPVWLGPAIVVFLAHQAWEQAWPPITPFLVLSGIFVILAAKVYALAGMSKKRIAALLDARAGLKDRLSNALEFSARRERAPLMELAIADAAETAAGLELRRLAPAWTPGNGRRLITLLALLPLLYVAAAVDLGALFAKRHPAAPGAAPALPPELAGSGFRELPTGRELLPALTGLRGLIGAWRDRLAELRERAQAAARQALGEEETLPEAEAPPAGPTTAQEQQGLALGRLPAVRFDNRVHLSDVAALGNVDPTVDENMRTAFGQLDQQVLDEDPQIAAVQAYVANLQTRAAQDTLAGQDLSLLGGFGPHAHDTDLTARFHGDQQGAEQQSFSEFLHQYAEHLARVAEAKRDANAARAQDNTDPNQQHPLVADQGQQTPPNAEQRLVRMTPDQEHQLQLSPQMGPVANPPTPGEGPSGAGRGGGTFRGSTKVKHLNQQGQGRQETLHGQVDRSRTPEQTFEDNEEDAMQGYTQLFQPFLADAQQTLNDPSIPLAIRTYVQRYLQSISPAQAPSGAH